MSAFINKLKAKAHRKSSSTEAGRTHAKEEPTFSILPHPAKTNDPADLHPTPPGGGLRSDPIMGAHRAHGPVIPDSRMAANIEPPLTHNEVVARTAELNRK